MAASCCYQPDLLAAEAHASSSSCRSARFAVANGQPTRSVPLDLEPYHTHTIDYFFYFPKAGKFAHFPVHVAKNEQFVIAAQPVILNVVEKPTKLDTSSWDYISQQGSNDDVLAYLNRENVLALNLDKIAFRMKDRAFFELVTHLLHDRHCYQRHALVVWHPPR